MNNITATIGLEQMKYIKTLTGAHKENAQFYDESLNNPKIQKLRRDSKSSSSCWIYSLLCENRDVLQKYLQSKGIHADVVHVRNDKYTVFTDSQLALDNLSYFNSRLLNIPVGWWLSAKNLNYIAKTINMW